MTEHQVPEAVMNQAVNEFCRVFDASPDQRQSVRVPAALTAALTAVAGEWHKAADVTVLAATLRATAADLDGFIQQRAEALAAGTVEQVTVEAETSVRHAQEEMIRQADLAGELRRRITVQDRTVTKYKTIREAALGVLRAYQTFLDTDDLDVLRDALTDLQEATEK